MNIAKICEIMAWENKNLGFIDDNGFIVPVRPEGQQIGQTIIFEDAEV